MACDAGPGAWTEALDPALPCWGDHRQLIARLAGDRFPGCAALNGLMPPGLGHSGGPRIHFVSSEDHAPGPYEQRIFETGAVSTRPKNWHDLFNALTWALLPRTKIAMNAAHCRNHSGNQAQARGPQRDALTLFDECGLILACTDRGWLERLARHDWDACLRKREDFFKRQVTLVVAGHALLEKLLAPYPSMTGNALLLHIAPDRHALAREQRVTWLDERLATAISDGSILRRPADLSPLPLMGIPGWWSGVRQDKAFYAERSVFRPPRAGKRPAPIRRFA